ncbi:probable serine/threonine-protein kinase roco6 [Saccostrea cucullata]|uniref:probable serine/threonine-protein kinase roco6 n=1 Tax=Saccostrea cuccullata TaxID=36930 RepID=UPI002ED2D98F
MDFGGQCAYYACHQVYLSRRAFYLLVIDMSKSFDEKVDPALCEQQGTMFADWTYGEYILFWLKSVHTYCESNAPVVIIGTHFEKVKGQNSDTFYNEILDHLQFNKHLKGHLERKRCFVLGFHTDGTPFYDTLSDLEKCIIEIAREEKMERKHSNRLGFM